MTTPVYTWRALAALLEYPSRDLLDHLDEIRAVIAHEGIVAPRALAPLFDALAQDDLIELQSAYTDTFDRGRSTSLLLFEHVHGESRDRGQAMVDLRAQYERAGLAFEGTQLPDHLPVFLEYCSVLPQDEAAEAIGEIAHIVAGIAAALRRRASPYACLLETLARLGGAPLDHEALVEDWTPAALDAAWVDEPVTFMGACAPQAQPAQQPVVWMDRPAAARGVHTARRNA